MKKFLRSTFYRFGPRTRRAVRRAVVLPLDLLTLLRHGGRPRYAGIPLPLPGEVFTGGGDFLANGLLFKAHFTGLGGLKPDERVLDIGSGLGRMAIPLTDYLSRTDAYEGFDVVREAVDLCTRRITSRYPGFRFTWVPLHNDLYTAAGERAAEFTFPYADADFDFAWATSVFTHMDRDEVARYLAETRRVMRPGGRFLATFFLMDAEAQRASQGGTYAFPVERDGVWYMDPNVVGANVAFRPEEVESMARAAGWEGVEIHYGRWSGRRGPTFDFQDVVVLRTSN
ncbi:MAG: class I SAM-dependent methyltransferase [Schleiferiaceae bacterium]